MPDSVPDAIQRLAQHLPRILRALTSPESTILTPVEEMRFRIWAAENRIPDVDQPGSFYDYRGFWKATQGQPHPPGGEQHFPDTFKQHGHPTFSQESQYSRGPVDGGMWLGDAFFPPMPLAVSHGQEKP